MKSATLLEHSGRVRALLVPGIAAACCVLAVQARALGQAQSVPVSTRPMAVAAVLTPAALGSALPAGPSTAAAASNGATLRDLLARSVPWDPQVRLAAAAQAVAQERLSQSKSRLWPTLGISATAGEGRDDDFGRTVKRRVDRSEMLLRWNLYNGGVDAAEITATEREWAATTEDLAQSLDLASERIANAYLDAWRWQSLMEPSLARVKTIERWVEQARTQVKAGRLSDADLQQAEYSLTDAQLSHQVLASELAGALGALNALLDTSTTGTVRAVLPQTLPRVAPEEARTLTPAGVRVARLRAEAAGSRVVGAASLAAPRVDLDARKRLSDNTTPTPTGTTQREGWTVGLRWEMPLGGETFSKRRETIARAEGAQAEVARIEQGLVSELASITPRLVSAEQAVTQLQSQAEQYNALLRAGRVQFEAGRRTLQQLIQLEDGRINVVQRMAEQNNRLDKLRLRLLVLAGRLSSALGIDPAPVGSSPR